MKYHAGQWVILSDYGMNMLDTKFRRAQITRCIEDKGYAIYHLCEPELPVNWFETSVLSSDAEDFIESEGPLIDIPQEDIEKLPFSVQSILNPSLQKTTTDDVIANPVFSDWELPEVMIGWVLYYVLFFVVGIFNSEIIQWVLRIILMVAFLVWRSKKVYGLK